MNELCSFFYRRIVCLNHVFVFQRLLHNLLLLLLLLLFVGRDSSVGIATRHGLDGPGIEPRWGRDFSHPSRMALGPTQSPIQWVPGLSRGQSGRELPLTTNPIWRRR